MHGAGTGAVYFHAHFPTDSYGSDNTIEHVRYDYRALAPLGEREPKLAPSASAHRASFCAVLVRFVRGLPRKTYFLDLIRAQIHDTSLETVTFIFVPTCPQKVTRRLKHSSFRSQSA